MQRIKNSLASTARNPFVQHEAAQSTAAAFRADARNPSGSVHDPSVRGSMHGHVLRSLRWSLAVVLFAVLAAALCEGWMAARAHIARDNERYRDLVRAVTGAQDLAALSGDLPGVGASQFVRRLASLPGVRDVFVLRNGDISVWASDPSAVTGAPTPAAMLDATLGGQARSLFRPEGGLGTLAADLLDGSWRSWRVDYLVPVLDAPARNVIGVVGLSRDIHSALDALARDVLPDTALAAFCGVVVALLVLTALARARRLHGDAHASDLAAQIGAVGADCATAVEGRLREFIESVRAETSGAASGDRVLRRAQAQHIVEEVDRLERWTSELCDYLDPDEDACADPVAIVDRALHGRAAALESSAVALERHAEGKVPRLAIGARLFHRIAGSALDGALAAMPHGGRLTIGMRHLVRHGNVEIEIAAKGPLVQISRDADGRFAGAPALVLTALRRIGGGLSVTRLREGGFAMILTVPTAGGRHGYRDAA